MSGSITIDNMSAIARGIRTDAAILKTAKAMIIAIKSMTKKLAEAKRLGAFTKNLLTYKKSIPIC